MPTETRRLVELLTEAQVRFIVVGGWAAIVHGSARTTLDLDIVYHRGKENIARLAKALQPIHPYLRGAPAGLPFSLDERTIRGGLNFTLVTDLGSLDLLGEIAGGGTFDDLVGESIHAPTHSRETGGGTPEGPGGACGTGITLRALKKGEVGMIASAKKSDPEHVSFSGALRERARLVGSVHPCGCGIADWVRD